MSDVEGPGPLVWDAYAELMPPGFRDEWLKEAARGWQPAYSGATEELLQAAAAAGEARLVVAPAAFRASLARSLVFWVANLARVFQPMLVGLAALHPEDPGLERLLDQALGPLALRGVVLRPGHGHFDLLDRRFSGVYERLVEDGAVLYVDLSPGDSATSEHPARRLLHLLTRYSRLKLVVLHAGSEDAARLLPLTERFEHLFFDLSLIQEGFSGTPLTTEQILAYQDRLLFGSGFPQAPYPLEAAVATIRRLQLGPGIEERLFTGNLARLFGGGLNLPDALLPDSTAGKEV